MADRASVEQGEPIMFTSVYSNLGSVDAPQINAFYKIASGPLAIDPQARIGDPIIEMYSIDAGETITGEAVQWDTTEVEIGVYTIHSEARLIPVGTETHGSISIV